MCYEAFSYSLKLIVYKKHIEFKINWSEANCYQADWDGRCPKGDFAGIN